MHPKRNKRNKNLFISFAGISNVGKNIDDFSRRRILEKSGKLKEGV